MTEIINIQRKISLEKLHVFRFQTDIAVSPKRLQQKRSVAFISDRRMKQLNEIFRGKNSTTDVLSFPFEADEFDPARTFSATS